MAPKAKAKATGKAKATAASAAVPSWASRNERGRRRRAAVTALNDLATEVGVKTARLKASAARVEALVRLLDTRRGAGDLPARLRAAVEAYPVLFRIGR